MNYIGLINQFWSLNKEHAFNTSEIALYFHLLDVSNSLSWKNPFRQGNIQICAAIGISEPTVKTARNKLFQVGLIEFKSGKVKRELTEYRLIELVGESLGKTLGVNLGEGIGENNFHLNVLGENLGKNNLHQSQPQTFHQSLANAFTEPFDFNKQKQNKTKLNKKKEEPSLKIEIVFPFESEKFRSMWEVWKSYKAKEFKVKYKSEESEQAALKKLSEMSANNEDIAIKIIEKSMSNSWQGLFPLKKEDYEQPINTTGSTGQGSIFGPGRASAIYDKYRKERNQQ